MYEASWVARTEVNSATRALLDQEASIARREHVSALLREYHELQQLSPAEAAFVAEDAPSDRTRVQFAWRYEGLGVMLWALGHLSDEELGDPRSIVDVPAIVVPAWLSSRHRDSTAASETASSEISFIRAQIHPRLRKTFSSQNPSSFGICVSTYLVICMRRFEKDDA